MKTITKTTKAIGIACLAVIMCAIMAFTLTACGDSSPKKDPDGITEYSATLDASISMAGNSISFGDVVKGAFVTVKGGKYTLTVTFDAGTLTVMGQQATMFVDDNPSAPTTAAGFADGTIGIYNDSGEVVTEGVTLTYSTGDDYAKNSAQEDVYYVKSASFPVEKLSASYNLTLYINSSMRGIQFSNDTYKATLNLDLSSGKSVNEISGLGVATRGTAVTFTGSHSKYGATLDSVVNMGQEVNFTANLLDGVYVKESGGKYIITLIFKSDVVNMPFGNVMTGFLTSAESVDYNNNTVTPVFGYYNGETLVTSDVTLTYSTGDDYVTVKGGSYYYVKSMTFVVNSLKDEYVLSLYVMAGNEDSASSMQFPYTLKNGTVSNAILSIDTSDAETVDGISDLIGVSTLEEVAADAE